MSLLNRLDRIPLSRPHYALLLMGGLGYTFDGMDASSGPPRPSGSSSVR